MIKTGFESRVKIQQIIDSQLPEFILDENPKAVDFLKQYYISQEYQSGPVDITDNLDQYLKLDIFKPEVIVGSTILSTDISSTSDVIQVSSTKGFPSKYGLLKIDDEIITYTGITTNTFTGCVRGFSGVTNYHKTLDDEELIFSTSDATSHSEMVEVKNLSVLFLQEFYKKIKYSLTPELENKDFVSDLNVGNFIKEAKTLYQTKGTEESFRILFNVLFGETPKVINLENFLIKPSDADYVRRLVVVTDVISGNALNLTGQTLYKNTDSNTTASISEVEVIKRKNKVYYKLLLFIGYDDTYPSITGKFNITGSTKNLELVEVGSSSITVDSTIGFPSSGKVYCNGKEITYTEKTINQFLGCTVNFEIEPASLIFSDETYYGYEDGDITKKVELRITGVLSKYIPIKTNSLINVGEEIGVKGLGKIIKNPSTGENKSYKEIFANSWIYNTSSRYQLIDNFTPGNTSQFTTKGNIDKSGLKVGDSIDILYRGTQQVVASNLTISNISGNNISTEESFILSSGVRYDIRRKIKNADSLTIPFEFDSITSDVQNVYEDDDSYMYVASNSLPSYEITKSLFSYNASSVVDQDSGTGLYSKINFSSKISFVTGSEVYYKPSETPISGLSEGIYYVEVLPGIVFDQIRLYSSRYGIEIQNYLSFGDITSGEHNFILNSQKEGILSPQKILRKFPLVSNSYDGKSDLTPPGAVGILVNGVEIINYKLNDKIYYGPLESVGILNGGKNYDVINPPVLQLSSGSALAQPVVQGKVEKIYVTPQDFDIDVIVSVALTGGNGSGAVFQPVIERKRREIEFDARVSTSGGGVNVSTETITFPTNHNLIDGQEILYRPLNNTPIGIGTFGGSNTSTGNTLKDGSSYYVKYVNDTTIRLFPSFSDYSSGINTIGFTNNNSSGIQKFATEVKNTLSEIKVISQGSNYTNRKLIVFPTGISTTNDTIYFTNHGFKDGEVITYSGTGNLISGLSTTNQYYVLKVDDNSFRLSDAGIGATSKVNYERKKYVSLGQTSGTGYHIFNYPEISLKIEYSAVGLNSSQFRGVIDATPIVRGEIIDAYVYDEGSNYGSEILNYHKKPSISIKNGKNAQCNPIIINGRIEDVSVQNSGTEYYSIPDIIAVDESGSGRGASLKPVIVNNKLKSVIVVNTGVGYSDRSTKIKVIPAGKNAIFDVKVRSLDVNNNVLLKDIEDQTSETGELVQSSYNNLQYGICGYTEVVQNEFGDVNSSKHSPIIGWAYDGNPIYGSYGYVNPYDKNSGVKRLNSGYELNISNVVNRPSNFSSGFFIDDYKFTNNGDLDQYNGRFCITPEFPNGVYAYFATSKLEGVKEVGSFPYFIGNRYRSEFITENRFLDQTFDFNNSSLIRNTFPYNVNQKYSDNDFLIESNEIINQFAVVESVTTGGVDNFEIVNAGTNYKVGDVLEFDESNTDGGGLIAKVSEIKGKDIVSLQTTTLSYDNAVFTWASGQEIQVKIDPKHNLNNLDYVTISGFSTSLKSLNGIHQIGVTSYSSSLIKDVPNFATTGIVTDIYVSNIPENISIGSSILIDSETISVLNVFKNQNIIRISRDSTGVAHTIASLLYFVPDTFKFDAKLDYFDSRVNDLVYFNPKYSVGVGTTSGISNEVSYNIGIQTSNKISIPTQSIYLPNHPFKTNQAVTLTCPSAFTVKNTPTGSSFSLPSSGNSQVVYIIRKSADYIGIVTSVGLTTSTDGLFFTNNGIDDYKYSIESNFDQIAGNVKKIITTVSVSTSHNLTYGDVINLSVKPNNSVGIGTSSSIKIIRDSLTNYILVNPATFDSSKVDTSNNLINITSHGLKTGDKVKYSANVPISGVTTGFYFIFKVDENNVKLSETYIDAKKTTPPNTISLGSSGGSSQSLSLVNPQITSIKNNNLVFDLTDSSLSGYDFRIFYDQDYYDRFVSTGSTDIISVGVSTTNSSLTINYSEELPSQLFYALEKSGFISTSDKEVENYSSINFVNSLYNNSYKVSGIGTTTFELFLLENPEKNSYNSSECDILEYSTSSVNDFGGVSKIQVLSPGINYKKLPIFKTITSLSGSGAYVIPKSENIGKINEIRILNEGFEYSSDKTLRPEANVPTFVSIKDSKTIDSIQILDGGKNYISSPDLVMVNTDTGEKIDSGVFKVNLTASSSAIESVDIILQPKGLPETPVTLRTINNSNGVGIQTAILSFPIVTCYLSTPSSGFGVEPFAIGDKIFVEGIQKDGSDGDGFNSENYGYSFFTVTNYTPSTAGPLAILEYSLTGFTTNPGTLETIQNNYGTIVNYNNYPKFSITQSSSNFILGEILYVKDENGFSTQDLKIVENSENYIKVFGSYELKPNQIIKGSQSGTIATVNDTIVSSGKFNVDYGNLTRIGWYDNVGKLNEDSQVISDNNYYQNLSYSVKSTQEWENIISPVNNLLHPIGLKNFADTQIINNVSRKSVTVNPDQFVESVLSLVDNQDVNTINNYDLSLDVDTVGNSSKFILFKNKRLADYFKCSTNRVLKIDDISSLFSSSNQEIDNSSKITDIVSSRRFNRYLVQVSNKDNSKFQFTEVVVLNNDSETFTLEKGTITTEISPEFGYETNSIGEIYGYVDDLGSSYLKFEPKDSYASSYNIKYLINTFTNSSTGVGTTSVGFVDLIGVTTTVSAGSTVAIIQKSTSNLESVHSMIHLADNSTNEMNYIELFVDHDGTDVNIAEFYFDTEDGLSSNSIGTFGASINGSGILSINYTNTSNNSVTIRSKNIGFGTTGSNIGIANTYRFKQSGQVDGYENTVRYDSLYSNVSAASTIISLSKNTFASVKSTLKVSIGNTSALHQVMMISDGNDVYTMQYPFLSIGSTTGIGSFGGEISGSELILKFYPDPYFSGNFEILSFNESFYRENDYTNSTPNLEYANILESVGVSKYISINDNDINRVEFPLQYQGIPIFTKTFDPSNSSILNPSTGEFSISNHFFSTGEELIYRPNSSFVGVAISAVGIGTTTLPSQVYAIKVNNDKFKIALTKQDANSGISVTFTSFGSGNAHEFEMVKKNEKTIISIDNIIQEPISYSLLNYTVNNGGQVSYSSTIFGLSGISSIRPGDVLKIDSEYMKVVNVGLGTTYSGPISFAGTFPLVNVERGVVGSSATDHSNSSLAYVYRGSYNIVKNDIYFTEAPYGGLEDQLFVDTDNLSDNRSYFGGRVFLRKDYTTNQIFDNISEKFTGIGRTYTLTVGGANTTGLGTVGSNGMVFINGIYQAPTTNNNPSNNFSILEDTNLGISSVVFSGITSTNGSVIISDYDINLNQLPRGGLIVSIGSSGGLGYAPLVGASVTAIVSGGSIIGLSTGSTGNWGSGYRNPVSVAVTGSVGSGATITASVGAGGTLSFTIVNGGSGYTSPTINISSPSYTNLPVTGVSRLGIGATTDCGVGLLLDIDVGASSTTGIGSTLFEVTGFKIKRNGYGFKKGDVIKPVGLVTAYGIPNPISEFNLTILDTFTDSFSAIQFGQIDYIDNIKNYQDGSRTRFPLYYNGELLSFEKDVDDPDSELINFDSLLIIFVNGVLQQPVDSYTFTGGTSFEFTNPPKVNDDVAIYFYRGSPSDSSQVNVNQELKIGDSVRLFSNNSYLGITTTQNSRTVSYIVNSNTIETNIYNSDGVNSSIFRPISWTKQKVDKIINGYTVSKARESIEPQIYPTAKIIKSFSSGDLEIFVDDLKLFNYENVPQPEIDFDGLIVSGSVEPVSAAITAVVSAAGTIQSLTITSSGSGYIGTSANISISSPPKVGVGIGTKATASVSFVNGSVSTATIINPGFGYTTSHPPQVIVPLPDLTYENIKQITGIAGTSGNIIGIGTTVGVGTALAINFTLSISPSIAGLSTGYPIYIFNTKVGGGVTSINTSNSDIIGIGTTFLDNIYYVNGINESAGIITCNVHSSSSLVGIATTGIVGKFSWGKFSGFIRSSTPISVNVSGFTVDSGLSTYPTIQRRGYGLRSIGPIKKTL